MGFLQQTWTLTVKNLIIVFNRHWLSTTIRAFLAPIIFMFFISYAKNFFVPPSDFGIGSPRPVRGLGDALGASAGGRNVVALVNNGFTGGNIESVINQIRPIVTTQGKVVQVLADDTALLQTCQSSIRGTSRCFCAVSFHSSPTEGTGGGWNYTIRADGSFGRRIFVKKNDNDAEIYVLPMQHAVDAAIATLDKTTLPATVEQYPFTDQTSEQRAEKIRRLYMGSLISILAVAYFIGIVGICYQLTGHMAAERELGMSQLIEAMMPNKKRWQPQAARILANHLAFDILYLPAWIFMGAIVARLNYPASTIGISIGYFIVAGLALSSWSIAFASLFRKAQLSGITVTIVSIVLAIIVQVVGVSTSGAAYILSLLFPPMNFTLFIIYMAHWEQEGLAANLSQAAPNAVWRMPGYIFFIFSIIQILVYPFVGATIERSLYGTASKARNMRYDQAESPETIKISSFSKLYRPTWFARNIASRFGKSAKETVVAVNNLDLSVYRGQIMVLLGANGSGKSTTLDVIAGLQAPTSGTIDIDGTGGLGLCPQKNVLWNELTVFEHVMIFNRLKSTKRSSKAEIVDLVASCDLDEKIAARTSSLSGGQKRKVQLAMMLTGGSSLCCLDEVSSGLDPLSRRKIWDILLAERGRRSILLTTHFLDEADLLSDQIAILSKGKLVADGSAVELKHRLGGGYRVLIYHENQFTPPKEWDNVSKRILHDHTEYQLAGSEEAARFIAQLEELGVKDYQVNGPTIENVFLKLAEEVKEEIPEADAPPPLPSAVSASSDEKGLDLLAGQKIGIFRQTWVLFRKRAVILRRNWLPYCAALLIPIITAALVTLFLKNFKALSCSPQSRYSASEIASFASLLKADIPVGPADQIPTRLLNGLYPQLGNPFTGVDSIGALNRYVDSNYSTVFPGGFFLGSTPTFAWRGNYDLSYAVLTQNLLDNSLARSRIVTAFQAFDVPWAPGAGKTLQFILYFGLAMSAYPGFFALYPTVERLNKVRALHYSNGVRAGPLWFAYTLFDFGIVLLASAVAIIIFVGRWHGWYHPGYLFVVFALYGLSATLMSYVVSLFTTSQLAAFAFAAGGQCVFFLIYFVAYMCIITYSAAADIDRNVNAAHFTLSLFMPAGNLLRSLLLTFNEFSLLCQGNNSIVSYPGSILVYGGPILYLILQSLVMLGVLVWWDSGWKPGFLITRSTRRSTDLEETDDVDADVFAEAARIDSAKDDLRVVHVSKAFGSNIAVQDITFGVPEGEVFALLGPNGAGKSTTIGLIRGDIRPSHGAGDVLVQDTSIVRHRAAARTHLGVCPQFDAMDQMTAIEHLRFYARARGVPDVEYNVTRVLHAVGLNAFKERMAAKLSGGNKRKLSLGIALMGNP
ncbi:hypothetical protein LTR66_013880, partial [Elasticomyces elasticus]